MHKITLITGLSNSGKTTYSQQYENVIHLDSGINIDALPTDRDIVIEGVFNTKRVRERILSQLEGKDFNKTCIWIDAPLEVCLRRNKERHQFPDTVIFTQANFFQEPTEDEGWDEVIRITDYNPEN